MKKILLIDDEDVNHFILDNLLRLGGFGSELIYQRSVDDGLEYLKSCIDTGELLPDTIFVDLEMPIRKGWEFLDEYKHIYMEFQPDCKVFVFTSSIISNDIERAKTYEEVEDYLSKPISIELLKEIKSKYFVKEK